MEDTKLTKQEKESKLTDEFDRYNSEKGETIHLYYIRFDKLMNDINIIGLDMTPLQVNTKFINHLELKWSRFVTSVKQANKLHKVSFDQLYAYLKQNEPDVNEIRVMKARFPDPLILIANTYNPSPSYSSYKYPPTNNQLRTSSNPRTQAQIQDGRVVVQNIQGRQAQGYGNAGRGKITGNIMVVRTVGDLNAIPPKAGIKIVDKQQDFLADGLKGFDSDCEELQLNATSILMTEKVDAYDSEVDDGPTANTIFMEKLSPASSINGDDVGPSYD
ncbi:hypothetical protein Tco_0012732 [Tanacetum coccineum]